MCNKIPCGHPVSQSLFTTKKGTEIPILFKSLNVGYENTIYYLAPRVWCVSCGWVNISEDAYQILKGIGE